MTAKPARSRSFPQAVACAFRGLGLAARTQPHFRLHLMFAAALFLAAVASGLSALELGVLAVTVGLVLAAELVNTSLELLTDIVHPAPDARAAAVKDVSAAAVLSAAACAAAVGAFLFVPHLFAAARLLTQGLPTAVAVLFFAAFLAGALRARR